MEHVQVSNGIQWHRHDDDVVLVCVVQVPNTVEAMVSMLIVAANIIVRDHLPSAVRVDFLKLFKGGRDHMLIIDIIISIQLKDSGRVDLGIFVPFQVESLVVVFLNSFGCFDESLAVKFLNLFVSLIVIGLERHVSTLNCDTHVDKGK